MRIVDYALATDGGTQVIDLEKDDGQRVCIGLDGRMDSTGAGKQLFIGAGPESPNVLMLPIAGPEENEVLLLLQRWLEETQGSTRREFLMSADIETLQGQDLLDRLALEFLLVVRPRDVGT
ncbi:MAG: hypothetical protein JSU95_19120 [Betaproteobacteria bacterium]|nr:MAG: hypothetical protein JSU95_19120 [Betaproteobacteria bacterium]